MKKSTILIIVLVSVLATYLGCTNAQMAQYASLGSVGEITCYSGGQPFYHGFSTGKISTENGSDGWFFQEQGTNKLIRVSGPCLIRN